MSPEAAVESREKRRNGRAAPPSGDLRAAPPTGDLRTAPPTGDLRAAPWFILSGAFAYAFVRYIIFGGVDPAQIPVFITNKALAVGSVIYLLLAGLATVRRRPDYARRWGRWTFHTAVLHAVLSLALLGASYYPKLFDGDVLSWSGELSILAAVLTLYCFYTLGKATEQVRRRRAAIACVLVCLHLVFYGYAGWFDVATWHGRLPPISLIAFGLGVSALVVYGISLRERAVRQGKGDDGVARRRA